MERDEQYERRLRKLEDTARDAASERRQNADGIAEVRGMIMELAGKVHPVLTEHEYQRRRRDERRMFWRDWRIIIATLAGVPVAIDAWLSILHHLH